LETSIDKDDENDKKDKIDEVEEGKKDGRERHGLL